MSKQLVVSEMAENLIGSEIVKMGNEISARIKNGEHIYNLTIGDFNSAIFPIPELLKKEIIKSYEKGLTNYPAGNGMEELRTAVAAHIKRQGDLDYDPEDILIACGGRPLIHAIYSTIVDPGDTVIFPVPSWNNNHYCHLTGAKTYVIETTPETNFMPSAEDIAKKIKDASLVSLCSPLNPTGTTFSKEQLESICNLIVEENRRRKADEKPVYLFYDKIYSSLVYGDTQHYDPVTLRPEIKDYTVMMDGISKAFAATGVRVGWAYGPTKLIAKMKAILSHVGAWAPKAEQMATAVFLNNADEVDQYLSKIRTDLHSLLKGFYEGFQELKSNGYKIDAIAPQAAMYLAVKIDYAGYQTPEGQVLKNSRDVWQYILDEAKVALVPFYCFGTSDTSAWYRLSVGTCKNGDISNVINNLQKALIKLKVPELVDPS